MLVLIRMIYALAVGMTALLSAAAIASPTTEPLAKLALLAVVALLVAGGAGIWRLTRERGPLSH
jgi:hypothetical protein